MAVVNFDEVPGGCRSFDCFEKLRLLGQGAYGEVSLAREKISGKIVAVKKLKLNKEHNRQGFPITAIREIKILKKLRHENVIKLKEIVTSPPQRNQTAHDDPGDIYMVFEYMDHDLTGLARKYGATFTVSQIKCYMYQFLKGLHYCHANGVLHRDIKSSNLLLNNQGSLKLGDFGLARLFSSKDHDACRLTNQVVTMWYRSPELLLGANKYGPAIDMWSAGCILAELLSNGKPLFEGQKEMNVLSKIVEVCGAPDETNWPGVSKLPLYGKIDFKEMRTRQRPLREVFTHCDPQCLELLEKMITLDPSKRISAKDALLSDYFWTHPLPCDPKSLPKYESSHELEVNQEMEKKRKLQQMQHEEHNAAKRQKPVQYNQRIPAPPPSPPSDHDEQSGQAYEREQPYRAIHGPRQRYEARSPRYSRRPSDDVRPYRRAYERPRRYESDGYGSGWGSNRRELREGCRRRLRY